MIAIIGCGNANRCDDGAGLAVLRLLQAQSAFRDNSQVRLFDAGTDGMGVMFAARGCSTLIVIDACQTGAEPGSVYEVPGVEAETTAPHSLSSHDFRWDHALYAGRQIYREAFPSDVVAYLIEARSLALGCELSAEVDAAAQKVAALIEARVRQLDADFETADQPAGAV